MISVFDGDGMISHLSVALTYARVVLIDFIRVIYHGILVYVLILAIYTD